MITVTVVLYRATAIVFYSFKSLRHLHLHTETEHMRYFSLRIGSHLLSHLYSTLVVDYISKIQFGRIETVEYYGRGPVENYSDRNHCTDLGLYRQSVDEQSE